MRLMLDGWQLDGDMRGRLGLSLSAREIGDSWKREKRVTTGGVVDGGGGAAKKKKALKRLLFNLEPGLAAQLAPAKPGAAEDWICCCRPFVSGGAACLCHRLKLPLGGTFQCLTCG